MKKIYIVFIAFLLLLVGCKTRISTTKNVTSSKKTTTTTKEGVVYHTVSFDTLGGNTIDSILVEDGKTIPSGMVGEKSELKYDYIFNGWLVDGKLIDEDYKVTGDITLTASYDVIEYIVVIFNSDGGTKIDSIRVTPGEKIEKPKNPTKITSSAEYEFLGWYINDSLFDFESSINEDITLIAKWKKTVGYSEEF